MKILIIYMEKVQFSGSGGGGMKLPFQNIQVEQVEPTPSNRTFTQQK